MSDYSFKFKLSSRLNSSFDGIVCVPGKHVKFSDLEMACRPVLIHLSKASLLTHYMLGGHRQISGNHLGTDHTPVTFSISIGRGSDYITLWLRCLCRVSRKSIHFCTCLPFFPPFLLDVFGCTAACRSESW